MYLKIIIDQLLPIHSRIIPAAMPRIPRAFQSVRPHARTLVNAPEDTLRSSLQNEGIAHAPSPGASATVAAAATIAAGATASAINKKQADIQSEYLRDARAAHMNPSNYSIDAASPNLRPNPRDRSRGNPEGMGMLDQVGSASGTAEFFQNGGKQGMAGV